MNAPSIHRLFYSIILLRALMCEAHYNSSHVPALLASTLGPRTPNEDLPAHGIFPHQSTQASAPWLTSAIRSTSKEKTLSNLRPSTGATPVRVLDGNKCIPFFIITGGLILVCVILLLSTLMLTCKVCQMSKRIRMLESHSATRMQSDGKYKSHSRMEAKETSVLLTNLSKTQEEMERCGFIKEGVEVFENGETGEGKHKEAAETAKSEEASDVTPVDDSSCLMQQKNF